MYYYCGGAFISSIAFNVNPGNSNQAVHLLKSTSSGEVAKSDISNMIIFKDTTILDEHVLSFHNSGGRYNLSTNPVLHTYFDGGIPGTPGSIIDRTGRHILSPVNSPIYTKDQLRKFK